MAVAAAPTGGRTDVNARRGVVLGIACTALVALWWLPATRLALETSGSPARIATQALVFAWLLRAALLLVLAPRAGAGGDGRAAMQLAAPIVCTAWPLLVLIWLASPTALRNVFLGEAVLLLAAAILPWPGVALARRVSAPAAAMRLATALGVSLTAVLWWGWSAIGSGIG